MSNEEWRSRSQVKHIDVDFFRRTKTNILWRRKILEMRSKNRRIGQNFEIFAEVNFDDESGLRKQFILIDESRWNLRGKNDASNRLVMRCFDDTIKDGDKLLGGTFRGGLELSVLNSLNLSIAAKRDISSFYIFLPDIPYITQLNERRSCLFTHYFFPLFPCGDEPISYFLMKPKFGLGNNFKIYEKGRRKKVAVIKHRVFNIGGRFKVDIFDEDLQYHKLFPQMLILACCASRFIRKVDRVIKKIVKKKKRDTKTQEAYTFEANKEELNMYRNPRYRR